MKAFRSPNGWAVELMDAENAIKAAVLAEREACAKVCEKAMIQMNYSEAPYKQCAAAIRARGGEK